MNRNLFSTQGAPRADTINLAGGLAHAMSAKHALAQLAATGCFQSTFYVDASAQLANVVSLCRAIDDPRFIAQVAIYARERAHMKDMPAVLTAMLAATPAGGAYLPYVFERVIDTPKMLANFVRVMRSGVTGRKSLGSRPKRLVQQWLARRSDDAVFDATAGIADPSLADVLRMVHPAPATDSRRALYGYVSGRNRPEHAIDASKLPSRVLAYEAFKADASAAAMPDVPHAKLTSLPLDRAHWRQIAMNGSWQMVRQNLNTFARHGVFEDPEAVAHVAAKLRSREDITRARAMPYQLMAAYRFASGEDIPREIRDALHDAMELAVANAPPIPGNVVVCVDVSGSMQSPVTGYRVAGTTKVRCIDVAALVAAAVLRKNPRARVIPFEQDVVPAGRLTLEPRDTIFTNADRLASIGGGGTNCSAPLALLEREGAHVDLVIYVSDNESWVDRGYRPFTGVSAEWANIKRRCPNARMVCIDLTPNTTTQAAERPDSVNVGGFSDDVFSLIATIARGDVQAEHWLRVIEQIALPNN